MDGFTAFAVHSPAGWAKFFFPGATEGWEGGQGQCPASGGKQGHVKRTKIKSTLHHWLAKWYFSILSGHIFILTVLQQTNPLADWCDALSSISAQLNISLTMKALNIQIGWIKVAVHASVDVIQSENTNLTLFVMQALGDDARVKHHVVRPQLDRCKGVVAYIALARSCKKIKHICNP